MALRARKVSGTLEKQAPGSGTLCPWARRVYKWVLVKLSYPWGLVSLVA